MNVEKTVTIHGVIAGGLTSKFCHQPGNGEKPVYVKREGKGTFQDVIVAMREDIVVVAVTTPDTQNAITQLVRIPDSAHSSDTETHLQVPT